ncbi:MAG: RluA family pseudouridine synthase [Sulfurimonas sp.]|uniref:RluA family pseudouridine synthase n=1 Tax=Sulfurimonas sp. TaxID=2022749 RepID=UPI002621CD53|nr:RluA family pseudouridine synthase [Sulfurimonas sp.]MDD2651971.1 RluA family pseudouridine synthase [Sulfurimonas sp.]MDD3451903.1 RluA family pseudouridine synthase [Sulfurimonas sp.]
MKKMFAKEKERAFVFLKRELGISQRDIQRYIAIGRVLVNGVPITKPSEYLEGTFEYICFEPVSKGLAPHEVHENFVVFDKPSGMLIHPQNRHTEYSLIDELRSQFGMEANIAHRIDQETSGLVLCARDKKSEIDIKMMFQEREMKKKYLAMVHGELKEELRIDAPLLRYDDEKSALVRMVVKVDSSGKESLTFVKPLKYFPHLNTTLVECSPHTGRQHQIRVHMFHMKHPIVGDPVYGQSEENIVKYLDRELERDTRVKLSGARRLLLHANELEFELYGKKYSMKSNVDFEQICFESMKG